MCKYRNRKKPKPSTWDWKPNRIELNLKNQNRPSPSMPYRRVAQCVGFVVTCCITLRLTLTLAVWWPTRDLLCGSECKILLLDSCSYFRASPSKKGQYRLFPGVFCRFAFINWNLVPVTWWVVTVYLLKWWMFRITSVLSIAVVQSVVARYATVMKGMSSFTLLWNLVQHHCPLSFCPSVVCEIFSS